MSRPANGIPPYRKHCRGQAFCVHNGKTTWLGKWGTDESRAKYRRFLQSLEASDQSTATVAPISAADHSLVMQLIDSYLLHAERYYVDRNGRPSKEFRGVEWALMQATPLFGEEPVSAVGPRMIRDLQNNLIARDYARSYINKTVGRVRRMFKWCCANDLCPPEIYQRLACIGGLPKGRTNARENGDVKPVAWPIVAATLPYMTHVLKAMVQVQYLGAMRPSEVCEMRGCDIDRRGETWFYRPADHKNDWRGHSRIVPLLPQAQAILAPFLNRNERDHFFSPRESEQARLAGVVGKSRPTRRTPIYPSELRAREEKRAARGRIASPRLRDHYSEGSYRQAVSYAIEKSAADGCALPSWHPYQLRHAMATDVAQQFGIDAAATWLGHATIDSTGIYVERQLSELSRLASKVGAFLDSRRERNRSE